MTTHRKVRQRAALVLAALLVAGPALAGGGSWSSSQNAFGTIVSNGQQSFFAPDEKAGRQMARALNKAEKKAERAEGNGGGQPAPDNGGNQGGEQGNGGGNESRD